jgi:uncharacterized protein (TIGR04255 family)
MNGPSDERATAVAGSAAAEAADGAVSEGDVAPDGAPFLLATPQIEVALVEFRFSPIQREITVDDALAIRAAMRAAGTELESVQPAASHELSVAMTPAGVQSSTVAQANGWQLSDTVHRTVVTVLPASVAVQTSRYERWGVTLRPMLEALLVSVGDVLKPQLRTRIGLRYVNRFADARAVTAGYWTERIDSALLGPLSDRQFADRVTGSQQQLDLADGPGRGQTIRHGCFQDAASRGAFSYLLDIDAYDTTTEQFVAGDALNLTKDLNRAAARTFRGALTDAYAAELGLVEVDGPDLGTTDGGKA